MKIVSVFGTRPETIKMAPVIREFARRPGFEHVVCVTGQHREMLDQALDIFGITPDHDLDLMSSNGRIGDLAGGAIAGLTEILERETPDLVLVQGDTATTLAGALSAFYLAVPVGHVEAGLRSHDLGRPWPEEGNRKIVSAIARLHFAPTRKNRENLIAEGVPSDWVEVTGNTAVDALQLTRRRLATLPPWRKPAIRLEPGRKLILVTTHRRENFTRLTAIWTAMTALAERDDCDIVYPLHLNPNAAPADGQFDAVSNIKLVHPLDFLSFVHLLERTDLLLTDSGGIQEEATALGKPVLLMRDVTERPEAVEAGTVRLVGTDSARIVSAASHLLDNATTLAAMSRPSSVFGDGCAAARIVDAIEEWSSGETSLRDNAAASR